MNIEILELHIKNKDLENFRKDYKLQNLENSEKQSLLYQIFVNHYNNENFNFFKSIFDCIIDKKLNLNFQTDDECTDTILKIVIEYAPHKEIFDYFITNGAKINFYVKYDNEPENKETCLDYLYYNLDNLTVDSFETFTEFNQNLEILGDGNIEISANHYRNLCEQSKQLFKIRRTSILRDFLLSAGAKKFEEL